MYNYFTIIYNKKLSVFVNLNNKDYLLYYYHVKYSENSFNIIDKNMTLKLLGN